MDGKIVPCPGIQNGTQCGFQLMSEFNKCPTCATPVDQAWFLEGTFVLEILYAG